MDKDLLIINRYLNRIYGDTPFDKIDGYYVLKEFVLVFGYSEEKSKKIIKRYFTNLGHKIPNDWFKLPEIRITPLGEPSGLLFYFDYIYKSD